MANKFPQPSLEDITREYLALYQRSARQSDFDRAEQRIQLALSHVRMPQDIRNALNADRGRRLPVQVKSPMYERLISLSGRGIRLLREYAQEMYDFGPDFRAYADSLWAEAKLLEESEEEAS
jgi:hypothetical protein